MHHSAPHTLFNSPQRMFSLSSDSISIFKSMDTPPQSPNPVHNDQAKEDEYQSLDHIEEKSEKPSLYDGESKAAEDGPYQDEDFEFKSWAGPGSMDSFDAEMCIADDIFFCGQILPLRRTTGLDGPEHGPIISRSESMDRGSVSSSGFRSSSYTSSSRSSSTGSSGKPRNPFHSYPSPSPRVVQARPGTRSLPSSGPNKNWASPSVSLWEFLRMGIVRAPPGIGPQHVRARTRRNVDYLKGPVISRSSSSGTNNNGQARSKRSGGGGIFGRCKFSVSAVETAAEAVGTGTKWKQGREERRRKTERHRTFEWIKDVSHVGVLNPV